MIDINKSKGRFKWCAAKEKKTWQETSKTISGKTLVKKPVALLTHAEPKSLQGSQIHIYSTSYSIA